MKAILFITVIATLSAPLSAKELAYSDQFKKCMNAAEGVTVSMRACYADEIDSQEKRLNLNYRNYLSLISPDIKKNFVNAQRTWVKYRDENCQAFQSQEVGGTLSLVVGDSCYLKMTTERADDFQRKESK
ncbi:lysozyme inhibitor LprI family protein [Erwinia psidii]|uniref:DUF1311 domain-containing protein n=1 Tax=Erwinia psidii TaxID=69224 RepID=A0A3N6UK92_9GAMM|nr:lysozyme inhibitor LprI family protein [Erwinia psidii]MCX8959575.1 DUF1311 domain-containing protein [Erwinia psidii]MCX8963409.1 DUF1311 domain-containing protein [Erwinia psidii]RQM36339.1 DUF1311 domain-containing protein [Erwinia psidii]